MTKNVNTKSWTFTGSPRASYDSSNLSGEAGNLIPSISGLTGTFGQGNTLTINGSSFTTNRSGQVIYENFDGGTLGNSITDIASFTQTLGATASHEYKYANDQAFSGTQSAKLEFVSGDASGFRPQFDTGLSLNKMFVALKTRVEVVSETAPDTQIKLARITSTSDSHTNHPLQGITYIPGSTNCFHNPGTVGSQAFYGTDITTNQWSSFIYYLDMGTVDQYDGSRFIKALGQDDWTYSGFAGENFASVSNDGTNGVGKDETNWEPTDNILGRVSTSDNAAIRYLLLPFFKRTADIYNIWIDQVFINDSLECVVMSPHATWTLAKADFETLIFQPMTSRSSSSIQVTCETGNLGATRYIYVMNSNGKVNETGEAI